MKESNLKFSFLWFLTLLNGIGAIYLLVQHAYTPGSTVVATAMVFAFAPMITFAVLRSLWVPEQQMYAVTNMFCAFTVMSVSYQNAISNCL